LKNYIKTIIRTNKFSEKKLMATATKNIFEVLSESEDSDDENKK